MLINRDDILKQIEGRPDDASLPIAVFRRMLMDAKAASYDELVDARAELERAVMVEYFTKAWDLYKRKSTEESDDKV